MANDCCDDYCGAKPPSGGVSPRYRKILWSALVVNAVMFGIELLASWSSGSAALVADAADFFGDAANYGVTLFVLALAPVWRSKAASLKGLTMAALALFALGRAAWNLLQGTVPEAATMGAVGALALAANLSVAALLYAFRSGDANMRSVWLCARNDAIGNVGVLLAALGTFGTGTGWPDLLVAGIMGGLGLTAARSVIRQAANELNTHRTVSPVSIHRPPA
jgi:Co/Zn/Cd efflux system component